MAEEQYKRGLELLKKQKPKEAIQALNMALMLDPSSQEAKLVLKDATEALEWSSCCFCQNCAKLLTPKTGYPWIEIDQFCPRCGQPVSTQKEVLISYAELIIKLVLFGIFPIGVLIFCGMPIWRYVYPYGMAIAWNRLTDGILLAAQLTLLVHVFLVVINDPWAHSLSAINYLLSPLGNSPLYFLAALLILFLVMYLYFFLLLTPILAIHKRGLWKDKKHHKPIFLYSLILVGLIAIIRIASGVIY